MKGHRSFQEPNMSKTVNRVFPHITPAALKP
jgi:hypothetical protein